MEWSTRRKLLYALTVSIVLLTGAVFLVRDILFPEPTCFDTVKNGFELGVDCGGVCSLKCSQEVVPLSVVWAKAVSSGKDVYDLVAMVSNSNIDNASHEVGYVFTLYNGQGQITGTLQGSTVVPLDGKFPIVLQNIPLTAQPESVTVTLSDGLHYSVQESPTSPTVKVVGRRYEKDTISRVYTTIMNTKRVDIHNLPVRVLLFDDKDNVYAVGQTIIPSLPKEEVREIVFTWRNKLPFVPTRIGVYPIFNPFEAVGF